MSIKKTAFIAAMISALVFGYAVVNEDYNECVANGNSASQCTARG